MFAFFFFWGGASGHAGSQSLNPWTAREVHISPLQEKKVSTSVRAIKSEIDFFFVYTDYISSTPFLCMDPN